MLVIVFNIWLTIVFIFINLLIYTIYVCHLKVSFGVKKLKYIRFKFNITKKYDLLGVLYDNFKMLMLLNDIIMFMMI